MEAKQFQATPELLKDLESLFQDGKDWSKGGAKRNAGKYTAVEAVVELKNMIDLNGWRKHHSGEPFGKLSTEKYIKAWFDSNTMFTTTRKIMIIFFYYP